ncbi:MAG TPA: hypothetical protein VL689_21785 [Paraburkholderia sp.]|nr:hypothetical protein [Paraburkholderia sp.]
MTSPIGSNNAPPKSSLTTSNESRNSRNSSTGSNAFPQPKTVIPSSPVGPLGHNVDTTA